MKRIHSGKMSDCKVCTPDQKPKRRERNFEPRVVRKVRGLEGNLRRQMAEEIGDEELSKDHRFQVMQHYGIIAPRIDRGVTKPDWMEDLRWIALKKWFHDSTKGMFPEFTRNPRRSVTPTQNRGTKPYQRKPHFNRPRPTSAPRG